MASGVWVIQSSSLPVAINPWLQLVVLIGAVIGAMLGLYQFLTRKKKQDHLAAKQAKLELSFETLRDDFRNSDFENRTQLQSIVGKLEMHANELERNDRSRERLEAKVDDLANSITGIDKSLAILSENLKNLVGARRSDEDRSRP
jgi:uncharacterized protein HemX